MIKAIFSKNILVIFLVMIKTIFPKKDFGDIFGNDKSNIFKHIFFHFKAFVNLLQDLHNND